MYNVKIITPYINEAEIKTHKQLFWEYDIEYEKDTAGIGSDLMFQKMWNKFPEHDIFILHADMYPYEENWLYKVLTYVNKYPEAGIFGCLLLYPAKANDKYIIQSAGGTFSAEDKPEHFGSGFIVENSTTFKEKLELDAGQYDKVREVAWTTFGGCYIRREVINSVGGFSADYEWTYNRDVDFCLKARQQGYSIYQIPVRLLHHESRDNKIIKAQNSNKAQSELRNLQTLQNKWKNSHLYKNLDREIDNE
jgi:GT2 family glycosyltransferase